MSKVLEVRKVIGQALETVHPEVYYREAPEDADYPHLVYFLPDSFDDGSMENFVLEVDGWDRVTPNPEDAPRLEILMDAADKALNGLTATIDETIDIIVRRDNRRPIDDDDKRLIRIQYVYQVRTFERRG